MSPRLKLIAYLGGTALFLLSLIYVGVSLARNWSSIEQAEIVSVPWLLACFIFYGASHFSTGLSWPLAVRQLGTHMSLRDGLRIGLVAQIGKYLPGNVAHYAGRGVLAKRLGLPFITSGISTAIEIGSALSAAVLLAGIALLIDSRPIGWFPAVSASGISILAATAIALVATWTWLIGRGARPVLIAGPALCLAISFVLSSLSVFALSHALGFRELSIVVAVGTFASAWAAGFVVPGAPAGLGVREATLLAMLGPMIGVGPAVAVALIHRLITAAVDASAAVVGYMWLTSSALAKK
jgi:uncharacterized membrane protein YbhN (UPF0104 family)